MAVGSRSRLIWAAGSNRRRYSNEQFHSPPEISRATAVIPMPRRGYFRHFMCWPMTCCSWLARGCTRRGRVSASPLHPPIRPLETPPHIPQTLRRHPSLAHDVLLPVGPWLHQRNDGARIQMAAAAGSKDGGEVIPLS